MRKLGVFGGIAIACCVLAAADLRAQSKDPYTAPYCEPAAQTELIYNNRAYMILPKPADAPPLYFSYIILHTQKRVERYGQLMFDDGDDQWDIESNTDGFVQMWPLKPNNRFQLDRIDRTTNKRAKVTFVVLGLEPIEVGNRNYRSWKIRRLDQFETGGNFIQFLWYSPELCTLSAFTDSQHRLVRLMRILEPGDPDYNRPVVRKKGKLYFSDTNEPVK